VYKCISTIIFFALSIGLKKDLVFVTFDGSMKCHTVANRKKARHQGDTRSMERTVQHTLLYKCYKVSTISSHIEAIS
jgi:hypothetical protein